MRIFHITQHSAWDAAQRAGEYRAPSLRTEGFIHFSTRDQVVRTANRFYRAQPDLVLLVVDPDRLDSELRYEEADGDRFPHLYGALNLQAVIDVIPFSPEEDGTFTLPDAVQRLA